MAFKLNPRCIAVEGVGFGTRALAVLGFKWFNVEIEIEPVPQYSPYFEPKQYYVTVRVRTKAGVVYEQSMVASAFSVKNFEKVVATFKGVYTNIVDVVAKLNTIIRSKITIRIRRK